MRVYQFRHIRADGNCSRALLAGFPGNPATSSRSRCSRSRCRSSRSRKPCAFDTSFRLTASYSRDLPNSLRLVRTILRLRRAVFLGVLLLAALPALASARGPAPVSDGRLVQVVVELSSPSAARSELPRSQGRVDLDARATLRRLTRLRVEQEQVAGRIADAVPAAQVRWRYRVVMNALAVVVPADSVARLEQVDGIAAVHTSSRYRPQLDRSPAAIGAPALWGPGLSTAGQGMKIGIIDDGIDHRHPFFDPTGYAMPPGFPKGQTAYTTAKVIAARSFPPLSPRPRFAELPFNPEESEHGTHVAGIAAGNNGTQVPFGGGRTTLSGVAPRAYLGNYRVLTVPTVSNVGLDGNSPEIAAAIEAAGRTAWMSSTSRSAARDPAEPRPRRARHRRRRRRRRRIDGLRVKRLRGLRAGISLVALLRGIRDHRGRDDRKPAAARLLLRTAQRPRRSA